MSKIDQSWTVVKAVKTDFIQNYCNRRKETSVQNGLSSKYSMGKWKFRVKEKVGVGGWKITKKRHRGGGIWAKPA